MKTLADGIHLAGRYGAFRCGCFVLAHNGHAAIVETPEFGRARNPIRKVWKFVRSRRNRLAVDFILLSHAHVDHAAALPDFAHAFPEARILLHRAFFSDAQFRWRAAQIPRPERIVVFDEPEATLSLGGEPLHLLYAPKHSWHDLMIVFRGAMITGDWWLGPGDPNPAMIPPETGVASCDRLLAFSRGYRIHNTFSAHANDLRFGLDFGRLMEATRDDRLRAQYGIPAPRRRARRRPVYR